MTCDRCYQDGSVGEHGVGLCPMEPRRRSSAVVGDEIPGGQIFENGFETPQIFYSHSAHRAALAERGLEIRAKWAGPNDKHMKRWDAPCAQTLENARILLTRGKCEAQDTSEASDFPITVTTITFPRES